MKLKLATRGSALALTQSGTVAERLNAAGHETELVVIRTAGDRSQAPSFGSIGAQGVFVREIEQALLEDEADLAVHSFKDLPTESPAGLIIAAVPPREDAADVLVVAAHAHDPSGAEGLALARGARVGTSSVRRVAWLKGMRPDLNVSPLRGNVPTRVGKLRDGGYDAIVLAAAGLARLSGSGNSSLDDALRGLVRVRLDPHRFVPAPAQGALAVQCRGDKPEIRGLLAALDHPPSRAAVTTERNALRRAEGGCNTAFGAYCIEHRGSFRLSAMLERNGRIIAAEAGSDSPEEAAERLWSMIDAEAGG